MFSPGFSKEKSKAAGMTQRFSRFSTEKNEKASLWKTPFLAKHILFIS